MKTLLITVGALASVLMTGFAFAQDANTVVDVPAPFGIAIFIALGLLCSPRKTKTPE
jgi:hypothetical protein